METTQITESVTAELAPLGVQLWPTTSPGYADNFTLDSVSVVRDVTAGAVPRQRVVHVLRLVTGTARELSVRANQREVGRAGMIEPGCFPPCLVVTAGAVGTPSPLMRVVGCMTGHAAGRCSVITVCGVTTRAGEAGVTAPEVVPGGMVIEAGVAPAPRFVALRAVGAEAPRVSIIVAVTGCALTRRLAIALAARVTTRARDTRMPAVEREIGRRVVERKRTQVHDVAVAPQVLGVAGAALDPFHVRNAAVPARVGTHIGGDVLVTRGAELRLALAVRAVVTLLAVLLDLRVRGSDLARHQQRLDLRSTGS